MRTSVFLGSAGPMRLEDGCCVGALSETPGSLAGELRPAGDTTEGRIMEDGTGDGSKEMAGAVREQESLSVSLIM